MTTCIPLAGGVPGLPGPPDLLAPGNNAFRDPRWRGAMAQGFPFQPGIGVGEHVQFRALYSGSGSNKVLQLSWLIKVDVALSNADDRLYVGFQGAGGVNDSMVIEITPYSASANITNGPVAAIEVYQHTGVGTWTPVAQPTWLSTTAGSANPTVWLETTPVLWAVQLRVPISASGNVLNGTGPNLPDPFRMWYYVRVAPLPADVATFAEWLAPVGTTHPSSDANDITDGIFPEPGSWDQFHTSTGAGDPICTAEGIELRYNDVGTHNNPSSQINTITPNEVFARPRNYTSSAIGAGVLHAHFRFANWGSVADPNAPWDLDAGDHTNAAAILPLAQGLDPPVSNPEEVQFNYVPPSLGGKPPHQCMLVELSGAGLTFSNSSVYRNMDFVNASVFRRQAQISIRGLAAIDAGPRDVYLYVQTLNMPARVEQPRPERGVVVGARPNPARGDERPPPPDFEEQNILTPTYRVHVFHSTDRTVTVGGRTRQVLEAQSSFGYYLQHNGALTGWRHQLNAPASAQLQTIADNFYKVVIPNDGAINITTAIEAMEPASGWTGCLLVPVRLAIVLLRGAVSLLEKLRDLLSH